MVQTWILQNPVTYRDVRVWGRARPLGALLAVSLAIVGGAAVAAVLSGTTSGADSGPRLGLRAFHALAFSELFIFVAGIPFLAWYSIHRERRSGTWDQVLMTRVPAWSIVWGKLLAVLAAGLLVVVASLPLLSLAALFGGVGVGDAVPAIAVLLVTTLVVGLWGLAFGLTSFGQRAVGAGLLLPLAITLGLSIVIATLGDSTQFSVGPLTFTPQVLRLAAIDPLTAMASAVPGTTNLAWLGGVAGPHSPYGPMLSSWVLYTAVGLALSGLTLVGSSQMVRPGGRGPKA